MAQSTDNDEDELEEQEELQGQMSFLDHLEELRKRLIRILIAVGVAFGVCLVPFPERSTRIIQIPIAAAITRRKKIAVWHELQQVWAVIRYNANPLANSAIQLNMLKPTDGFNLAMKVAFSEAFFWLRHSSWGRSGGSFLPDCTSVNDAMRCLSFSFRPFFLSSAGCSDIFVAFPFAMKFLLSFGQNDMGMKPTISGSGVFRSVHCD